MPQTKNNRIIQFLTILLNGVLFAVFSLLNTFNENISQLGITQIIRPLILCILGILIIGLILYAVFRSSSKASMATFVVSILFFTYGHILFFFENNGLQSLAKHRILVPAFVLLLTFLIFLILRGKDPRISKVNGNISLFLGFLVAYNLVLSGIGLYKNSQPLENQTDVTEELTLLSSEQTNNLPDIYWIILDGYERKDALKDHYGYDNSEFLGELTDRGFIIPECSLSNYPLTAQTISTALNMDYLEKLSEGSMVEKDHLDYRIFRELIANSKLENILKRYGYQIVAFKTEYSFTELTDADYYILPPENSFAYSLTHPALEAFEEEFFSTTIVKIIFDMPSSMRKQFAEIVGDPAQTKYDLLWFNFNKLKKIPELPEKKFVFAHLLPTHQPFVMKPDGSYQFIEEPSEGYINSLIATNDEMLHVVDEIIARSSRPPVIIIQGDHAFADNDKTKILNAYYLPGLDPASISKDITPINSFRLVLTHYFDLSFPQLENQSYLTPEKNKPLNFIQAPLSCY